MAKHLYKCPVCKKDFKNERAVTVHLVYTHKKILTEGGKPIDLNVTFTPIIASGSSEEASAGGDGISSGALTPIEPAQQTPAPRLVLKKRPLSNLNEILDAQLEIQAKLTEIKILKQLDLNTLAGNSPELESVKQQLQDVKTKGLENSIAELKDIILSLSDQDEEGDGLEKTVLNAVVNKLGDGQQKKDEVFDPNAPPAA